MDPNQTLRELRDYMYLAAETLDSSADADKSGFRMTVLLGDIVQRWQALDEWLTRAGGLPDAWNVGRVDR
jgi:hypothetical protein